VIYEKITFPGVVTVSVVLAACQVNNVRDTGGGAVSFIDGDRVTLDSGYERQSVKDLLEIPLDRRNLLLCKRKNRLGGGFSGSKSWSLNRGNWLEEHSNQNLFFQFSLNRRITSRLTPLNQLPVAAASGAFACLTGLDSR
jgi:hypothetical protein